MTYCNNFFSGDDPASQAAAAFFGKCFTRRNFDHCVALVRPLIEAQNIREGTVSDPSADATVLCEVAQQCQSCTMPYLTFMLGITFVGASIVLMLALTMRSPGSDPTNEHESADNIEMSP